MPPRVGSMTRCCAAALGAHARDTILSRGGLELLDDDLIDPAFVSLSMESWH
jgi:hypothetical protein